MFLINLGFIAVSRKVEMRAARAFIFMHVKPNPPCFMSLNRIISVGFISRSAYMNFLAAELKCCRSETLGAIVLHLYKILLKAYRFVLCGRSVKLMNLPPLHGPITLFIRSFSTSPLTLLVR